MKTWTAFVLISVLVAWSVCGVAPAIAHHAFASEFDLAKSVHIEGRITQIEWKNPHVYFKIAVADQNGATTDWRCELVSVSQMVRLGIVPDQLSLSSEVTVEGFAAKTEPRLVGTSAFNLKGAGKIVTIPMSDWHHSYAETYDKPIQRTGKILSIDWINPTPKLHFEVMSPDGQTQVWIAEMPSMSVLRRTGWTKETLAAGDLIQVGGAGAKDGSTKLFASNLVATAMGGRTLSSPRTLLGNASSK